MPLPRSACAPTRGRRRRRNPAGSMRAASARSRVSRSASKSRCDDASVSLVSQTAGAQAPFTARLGEILVIAQIYQPKLLIAEFKAPATIADRGQPPSLKVNWSHGPEAAWSGCRTFRSALPSCSTIPRSIASTGRCRRRSRSANHVELHGRLAEGSAQDNPVIETALQIAGGSVQEVHPLLAQPFDADIADQADRLEGFFAKAVAGTVSGKCRRRAAMSRSCGRGFSRAT